VSVRQPDEVFVVHANEREEYRRFVYVSFDFAYVLFDHAIELADWYIKIGADRR